MMFSTILSCTKSSISSFERRRLNSLDGRDRGIWMEEQLATCEEQTFHYK